MFTTFFRHVSFVVLFSVASFSAFAKDTATQLFERNAPLVFQIKVIDKASGNKATIGSGFQISPTGVLATNYHVVSDYILDREKYRIEVRDHDDEVREALLVNFDIVHDLALLQHPTRAHDPSLVSGPRAFRDSPTVRTVRAALASWARAEARGLPPS